VSPSSSLSLRHIRCYREALSIPPPPLMKSLILLPTLLLLLLPATFAWRFVSKVEELPVEITDRLERARPKVRLCSKESEESTDCVLCTVCHPHEYELIGCSGQMDSVCASCTTGWMRNTPKTVDFFRKCKTLPFLFPDISFPKLQPLKLESVSSSMFADQEKMLQDAENTESAEMDDELSEEKDDYDWEDDEEEEEDEPVGIEPVVVDETEEDSQSAEAELEQTQIVWRSRAERVIALSFQMDEMDRDNEAENESVEDEDSVEQTVEDEEEDSDVIVIAPLESEETSDPFDSKIKDKEAEDNTDEESEELDHRVYPLHRDNIWRIIGPEITKIDDKDISKELRKEISERKEAWRNEKGMKRYEMETRKILSSDELIDDYADPFSSKVIGGYRPLPVNFEKDHYSFSEVMGRMDPLIRFAVILCFALVALILVLSIKICFMKRRNRVIILPELDEISRQLIEQAHARVHGNKYKKMKPEFV
ncbi:hypothetical protein PENTCL1PPCAC_29573, partial [Pristionchus entomophagus]